MEKIIFFGNGPLAEFALAVLERECQIIFHAHTKEDLVRAVELKREFPEAHGVLASFGVMIKEDVLEVFEPEGILNIHPSLLPLYRGPSPIESAILAGDEDFSVSVMKLAKKMDAGPIYHQETLQNLPFDKEVIYRELATAGAKWIVKNLQNLPTPVAQDDKKATYTEKLTKEMGWLTPESDTAGETMDKIVAFQWFPKPKCWVRGIPCIILEAHAIEPDERALLTLYCADGMILVIDKLQPAGRKPMDARSFLNGYAR